MNILAIMLATTVNFTVQTAVHPDDFKSYDTAKTRERFVMEKVMAPDEINVTYTMYDRLVYGGAMPVEKELTLDTFEELKAEHFLDRRELGVINVGGPGTVTVDGEKYDLEFKEALYVGCGKKDVKFASKDKANPAKFYLNSAPAYKEFRPELQEAGLHDRQLHQGRQDGGVERPRHQPAHREPRADEGSRRRREPAPDGPHGAQARKRLEHDAAAHP